MIDRAALTYRHLFPTEAVKAEAFDKIAELFYNCNFGSTSKADIETLMFSIFIERILKEDGPENLSPIVITHYQRRYVLLKRGLAI